jgi:hypothetical protein
MRNDALMFSGGTDLTITTSSGSGSFRTPGTVTNFKVAQNVTSTTSGTVTTTTTQKSNYQFTYQINYDAILFWIKNCPNNPFPASLRAGGILYYSAIPDHIDTTVFPIPATSQANKDMRFWKEYIDEVLGLQQYGFATTNGVKYAVYNNYASRVGYGPYFNWAGNNSASTKIYSSGRGLEGLSVPSGTSSWTSTWQNAYNPGATSGFDTRYMDYRDNPVRPNTHFWFGPMTMLDFLGNIYIPASTTGRPRNWMPGTSHESPMWQLKAGMVAAINDIKSNHANDLLSLIAFSEPTGYTPSMGTTLLAGNFNSALYPLGRDYNALINSLYFSPTSYNSGTPTEISPYDAAMDNTPRAIGGTCPSMGLMLAYNQFSRGSTTADLQTFTTPVGQAGGLGRNGAQKLVVFQTDGVPTASAYDPSGTVDAIFQDNGPYQSYFKVRYDTAGSAKNEYPPYIAADPSSPATPVAANEAIAIAQRLCNPDSGAGSGFSSARKPVRIHCIAFGSLFDNGGGTTALNFLQNLQYIGGTQPSPSTPLPSYKIITGTSQTRINNLQTAYSNIMQDGYSVTLIN